MDRWLPLAGYPQGAWDTNASEGCCTRAGHIHYEASSMAEGAPVAHAATPPHAIAFNMGNSLCTASYPKQLPLHPTCRQCPHPHSVLTRCCRSACSCHSSCALSATACCSRASSWDGAVRPSTHVTSRVLQGMGIVICALMPLGLHQILNFSQRRSRPDITWQASRQRTCQEIYSAALTSALPGQV